SIAIVETPPGTFLGYQGRNLPDTIPTMPVIAQKLFVDWVKTNGDHELFKTCIRLSKTWRNIAYEGIAGCEGTNRNLPDGNVIYKDNQRITNWDGHWYGKDNNYDIPFELSVEYIEADYWNTVERL